MEQQFVVSHRFTVLQQADKTWPTLNRPTLRLFYFLRI
jgi:hypothetical protein